jgi:hypothetical protein
MGAGKQLPRPPGCLVPECQRAVGIVVAPRALWRAFVRGRHSANLYGREFSDELLDNTVGDLRVRLRVDGKHEARLADGLAFALWIGISVYLVHRPARR